ncbi:hypothetical protein SSX86_001335 [Deinandra increscens subsp. villosa]|uniref:Remorin C-terminal domain-containing protein n=1 Tax=Deinandra increscens subsp. villosa TaxID=3103831 RepID=A0AAP0HCH8_9ASTR
MGEEQDESKKEAAIQTESKSPVELKSSPVATPPPENANSPRGSDINAGIEIVVTEKRLALIKAWEENEKTRADNKAYTKISAIGAWENTKRAAIEADLKQIEEDIEIEKAKQREKMKNKISAIHKEAEEKRAVILAKKGQDIIKVEEAAAKFHATGTLPSRLFKCLILVRADLHGCLFINDGSWRVVVWDGGEWTAEIMSSEPLEDGGGDGWRWQWRWAAVVVASGGCGGWKSTMVLGFKQKTMVKPRVVGYLSSSRMVA